MCEMSTPLQYASFLIRMWRQPCSNLSRGDTGWQCEVEHIQSGEHWTFNTLSDLLAFLRRQAEEVNA
jgi:hypothetical protein